MLPETFQTDVFFQRALFVPLLKDWRNQNTLKLNGKVYVPLCRIEKINHENPDAYLVYYNQWIPKSCSIKDDKYLYCEEWMYKKIEEGFKEK